jgi:exopolyphosphatase/guanosine-5'-triphosphate,3'-diphosphate pyrophosphatase
MSMTDDGRSSDVRGALDVGSNTVRVLIATVRGTHVEPLFDRASYARLGRGVDRTGMLETDRMDEAVEAIREFARLARVLHVTHLAAVATSAIRDASNGAKFVQRVEAETGVHVEVISGEREAELTFRGATCGHAGSEPEIVVDLGGGSMEIVRGECGTPRDARSLQLGAGRLTERFIAHDPPLDAELEAVEDAVAASLPSSFREVSDAILYLTGGTASHVAQLARLGAPPVQVRQEDLLAVRTVMQRSPAAQIAVEQHIHPERALVLPAGAAALQAVLRTIGAGSAWIVNGGLREGLILAAG